MWPPFKCQDTTQGAFWIKLAKSTRNLFYSYCLKLIGEVRKEKELKAALLQNDERGREIRGRVKELKASSETMAHNILPTAFPFYHHWKKIYGTYATFFFLLHSLTLSLSHKYIYIYIYIYFNIWGYSMK